jgi:hypothetical protein
MRIDSFLSSALMTPKRNTWMLFTLTNVFVHRVVDETRSTMVGFCRRLMAGIQGLQRYGKFSFLLFWMNRDESMLSPILCIQKVDEDGAEDIGE